MSTGQSILLPQVCADEQQPLEVLERFRKAPFKIAIQKDGELTEISRQIISQELGICIPPRHAKERCLLDISEDGRYGVMYTRNKDICKHVASGAVDLAIVGLDRLIEDGVEERVVRVRTYKEYSWRIVLATPQHLRITNLEQITRVATQYPEITRRFFQQTGQPVSIIQSAGGTEVYPHILHEGDQVQAIVDLVVSGKSLAAHDLVRWDPAIMTIFPVMIVHPRSLQQVYG
jgi:ATP phosphoribosyltransferase